MTLIAESLAFIFGQRDVILVLCTFAMGIGIIGTVLEFWKYRNY